MPTPTDETNLSKPSLGAALIESLADTSWDSIGNHTKEAVVRCMLQVLGFARLGMSVDPAGAVVRYVKDHEGGDATVVGMGKIATASSAAMANAIASHVDFREDTHSGSQSHPGVTLIPATLAAAEIRPQPCPAGLLGEAIIIGYEVVGRLGRAGAARSTERGFRASSLYTLFGAAAAASWMLSPDQQTATAALSIAAQGASGLNQPFFDGTNEWFVAPGLAARHGVTSALLARRGIQAAPRILEGRAGLFAAFADVDQVSLDLTPVADVSRFEVERTRLKAFLTCGWNQSLVHLLRTEASEWELDDIDMVSVELSPEAAHYPGVAHRGPFDSRTSALLSAPYAAALQLVRGRLAPSGYGDLEDEALRAVANRVHVEANDELAGYDTVLTIAGKNGAESTYTHTDAESDHTLTTVDDVEANLRDSFEDANIDGSLAVELRSAICAGLDHGEITAITKALS